MEAEDAETLAVKKSDLVIEMEASLPAIEARSASGDLDGSIETLFTLEKKCRMVRPFAALPISPPASPTSMFPYPAVLLSLARFLSPFRRPAMRLRLPALQWRWFGAAGPHVRTSC